MQLSGTGTTNVLTKNGVRSTSYEVHTPSNAAVFDGDEYDYCDYDINFDVYNYMNDDGTMFFNVTVALEDDDDGVISDLEEYKVLSEETVKQITKAVFIDKTLNAHDIHYMMEVFTNPLWLYGRYRKFGNWTDAFTDGIKVFQYGNELVEYVEDFFQNEFGATIDWE